MILPLLTAMAHPAEPTLEITVWGQFEIQAARSAIVREMERIGWKQRDKPDGRIVFRPPKRWMGRAHLDAEGDLTFTRPIVAWHRAELADRIHIEDNPNLSRDVGGMRHPTPDGSAYTLPPASAKLWVLPSMSLLAPLREAVRAEVHDELTAYRDVRRDTWIQESVLELRDDLDLLWKEGRPLVGTTVLATPEARRQAVLAFWSSRTDTREGLALTTATERWLERVVQPSKHPVSESERTRAEAARTDGRRLLR